MVRPSRQRLAGALLLAPTLVAAIVLAACASNPEPPAGNRAAPPPDGGAAAAGATSTAAGRGTTLTPGAGASTTTTDTATSATTSSTTAPSAPGGPVTIAFGGDVHGEPPIRGVLDSGGNPLQFVAALLSKADLAVVNLETVIGNQGAARKKKYVFRAPSSLLAATRAAGVDAVSLANNHSFDFGLAAFTETIRQVKAAGLAPLGAGADEAEAYAPAIFEVNGTKVAILGIAKVWPDLPTDRAVGDRPGTTNARDVERTTAAIRRAKEQAPVVVAFLHWGIELARCPSPEDRQLARAMVDAGASAVIGAHPHVLQGISNDGGTLVAWSLGNFVFYAKRDVARNTGVLTVTFGGDGAVQSYQFDPARIDGQGRPVPLTGPAAAALSAEVERLRPGAGACPG